jgi:hypothetical protein
MQPYAARVELIVNLLSKNDFIASTGHSAELDKMMFSRQVDALTGKLNPDCTFLVSA